MKKICESSFNDYVQWYLTREYEKHSRVIDNPSRFENDEKMIEYMVTNHEGKLRDWFNNADWGIHTLEINDLDNLVCLEGCEEEHWTRAYLIPKNLRNKKNYRILKQIIENAKKLEYFTKTDEEIKLIGDNPTARFKYYNKYKNNNDKLLPALIYENRIVLCELSDGEKSLNPFGSYYLHDGFGRLLAYHYLISYHDFKINGDIEAFIVKKR